MERSVASKLLSFDFDESEISTVLPSLVSSSTGVQIISENSLDRLVQLEKSGDADALVNETRKVLSVLNTQLQHQQVVYELTIKEILLEVKRLRSIVKNKEEEVISKVTIIDQLSHQVREYQKRITTLEQTISGLTIQVRQYEEQILQIKIEIEHKITTIQNLEIELKSLQNYKIQFMALDVEKISFETIRKTLLDENIHLRKWKTELEAKIISLEQIKFQLTTDFVKLTETILINSKVHQPGSEEIILKGRLIAEKENVALLQQHVEGLLSRVKDLEVQIVELKQKNKRLTDELSIEIQRHEEDTKTITELNQKVFKQSQKISELSKIPDSTVTKKVSPTDELALKVFNEKLEVLSANQGVTLKTLDELHKEVETVRASRDAAYSTMERFSSSLGEIRKLVIERTSVSVTLPPIPILPVPPVTPPKPRAPAPEISEQTKRYHDLLNSPPSKKRKD